MFVLWIVFVLFVTSSLEEMSPSMNPNIFCSDLNPQPHVDIEQLMGMWFAIEIISHKPGERPQMEDYVRTCPVIYINEDRTSTTMLPLYKNYNPSQPYGSGYGSRYSGTYGNAEHTESSRNPPYETGFKKEDYQDGWTRYGTGNRRQHRVRQKKLQLVWTDEGAAAEYSVYYTNRAGVWYSSGPHNGSSLQTKYDHFAGVIQVIKAVGNHLVLTFCYRLPDSKLYTVLLSRMHKLDQTEINGVRNLLTRKGLETIFVKKACSHNGTAKFEFNFNFVALLTILASFKSFEFYV